MGLEEEYPDLRGYVTRELQPPDEETAEHAVQALTRYLREENWLASATVLV
jgi:hypothetical protein